MGVLMVHCLVGTTHPRSPFGGNNMNGANGIIALDVCNL